MITINVDDDDDFIEALGKALDEVDPVPESVKRFGRGAHRLVAFDAELAEILDDSRTSGLSATRSANDVRTVRFGIRGVEIEIELGDDIVGNVEPRCAEIVIVTASQAEVAPVNDRGFFRFDTPVSAFRLECIVDGASIRTPFLDPS